MTHHALNIPEVGNEPLAGEHAAVSATLFIGNAGLCMLSPWFPQLLNLAGYLDEGKKDFKDEESKIRALFLLQYLACSEEKEYGETELAFNRLLVALPMHIPVPNRLELTDMERQAAESMLRGVKSNYSKFGNTSIKGFQDSFIVRKGSLQQQEQQWRLNVECKAYDILLDSLPWSFSQIHFPWLKKHIQIFWRENQKL